MTKTPQIITDTESAPELERAHFDYIKATAEAHGHERRTFAVPDENLEQLDKELARLNRKARKLGLAEFVVAVCFYWLQEITATDGLGITRVVGHRRWNVMRLDGPAPRLDGWTFIGVLDFSDPAVEGYMVRMAPGYAVPDHVRSDAHDATTCDHCQSRRHRKETFMVQHDDGRIMQVGRNCLRDFLGNDPKAAIRFFEYLHTFEARYGDPDSWGSPTGRIETVGLESFLTACRASMREDGWVSRGRARDMGWESTSDIAWSMHMPPFTTEQRDAQRKFWAGVSDLDKEWARDAFAWRTELWEDKNAGELSDYIFNLRAATSRGVVSSRTAGLAASLLRCYERHVDRVTEAKRNARLGENSRHVGAVKERIEFVATVESCRFFANDWGGTTLVTFTDDEGNLFKWWSSGADLEHGKRVGLRGTVKKHGEYKGVLETTLTRCTVYTVEETEAHLAEAKAKAERKAARAAKRAAKAAAKAAKAEATPSTPVPASDAQGTSQATPREGTTAALVMEACATGPKTIAELVEYSGKSECAVRRYAGKLVKVGELTKTDGAFAAA